MATDQDIADVLVIGAGASSAAFTWSLTQAGIKVVCLEQGGMGASQCLPRPVSRMLTYTGRPTFIPAPMSGDYRRTTRSTNRNHPSRP